METQAAPFLAGSCIGWDRWGIFGPRMWSKSFPGDSVAKNLPAKQETQVRSLGWEDPLEKKIATSSCFLSWRIPVDRGTWQATVHGVTKESNTT